MTDADWSPERYARFGDLRLRPALDLLAQVPDVPQGDVVDLGCGGGAVGRALTARFAGRSVIGVDTSPAMLDAARMTGAYTALQHTDAAAWHPARPPALIFSNAALQWVMGHDALIPHLAGLLAPGGVLAVQMPRQWGAPSHRFIRDIAASLFGERMADVPETPVLTAVRYWEILHPFGQVAAWESDYVQRLAQQEIGHPVRAFTSSTALRPFLARLTPEEETRFLAAYDAALGAAYPLMPDGAALMPFRRVFFTLQR